jgi:hypothetical protein
MFDNIEQKGSSEKEIEIIIMENFIYFSWNDNTIQDLAEALGETEFRESRPCG